MRLFLGFLVVFGLVACGAGYEENDLTLLTHYTAKEYCSCLFVMRQSRDYCTAWTVASPNVATVSVDEKTKTVRAQALLLWGARARFVDAKFGCILD